MIVKKWSSRREDQRVDVAKSFDEDQDSARVYEEQANECKGQMEKLGKQLKGIQQAYDKCREETNELEEGLADIDKQIKNCKKVGLCLVSLKKKLQEKTEDGESTPGPNTPVPSEKGESDDDRDKRRKALIDRVREEAILGEKAKSEEKPKVKAMPRPKEKAFRKRGKGPKRRRWKRGQPNRKQHRSS